MTYCSTCGALQQDGRMVYATTGWNGWPILSATTYIPNPSTSPALLSVSPSTIPARSWADVYNAIDSADVVKEPEIVQPVAESAPLVADDPGPIATEPVVVEPRISSPLVAIGTWMRTMFTGHSG